MFFDQKARKRPDFNEIIFSNRKNLNVHWAGFLGSASGPQRRLAGRYGKVARLRQGYGGQASGETDLGAGAEAILTSAGTYDGKTLAQLWKADKGVLRWTERQRRVARLRQGYGGQASGETDLGAGAEARLRQGYGGQASGETQAPRVQRFLRDGGEAWR